MSDHQTYIESMISETVILFILMVMTGKLDCTAASILASVRQAKRGVPMFCSLKHVKI